VLTFDNFSLVADHDSQPISLCRLFARLTCGSDLPIPLLSLKLPPLSFLFAIFIQGNLDWTLTMVGVTVSSIGVIAMFMIGASGLAVNPGYRPRALDLTERDVEPMVARAISLPRRGMEEILAEKEKRCIQPSDSLTPDSATCNSSAADGDTLSDLSLPESHASIGDVHALPDKSRASSSGTFTGDLT